MSNDLEPEVHELMAPTILAPRKCTRRSQPVEVHKGHTEPNPIRLGQG